MRTSPRLSGTVSCGGFESYARNKLLEFVVVVIKFSVHLLVTCFDADENLNLVGSIAKFQLSSKLNFNEQQRRDLTYGET